MIRHTQDVHIRRASAQVYDFVASRYAVNHPRWEEEIVEIRPLDGGPIAEGSRFLMVRKDFGRIAEAVNEVVELVPGRRIAFRHVDEKMDFHIAFNFDPVADGTRLRVEVGAEPHGAMRLITPMLRLRMPRIAVRNSERIRDLVESEAA